MTVSHVSMVHTGILNFGGLAVGNTLSLSLFVVEVEDDDLDDDGDEEGGKETEDGLDTWSVVRLVFVVEELAMSAQYRQTRVNHASTSLRRPSVA